MWQAPCSSSAKVSNVLPTLLPVFLVYVGVQMCMDACIHTVLQLDSEFVRITSISSSPATPHQLSSTPQPFAPTPTACPRHRRLPHSHAEPAKPVG
jgi:hypothetical protein